MFLKVFKTEDNCESAAQSMDLEDRGVGNNHRVGVGMAYVANGVLHLATKEAHQCQVAVACFPVVCPQLQGGLGVLLASVVDEPFATEMIPAVS